MGRPCRHVHTGGGRRPHALNAADGEPRFPTHVDHVALRAEREDGGPGEPVRLEFVVRPPLGAGPSPGSGT